jgi:pyruvate/2-oxoglutarate dehydrogenase complex dihydrolipoamide acyltransferase (E2) component
MDVEAQEDGILAKIVVAEGAKAIQVGSRIAVLAEEGDDLANLEIPAEDSSSSAGQPARKDRPSPQEELKGGIDTTESSPSAAEAPPSSKPNADAGAGGAADTTRATQLHGSSDSKARKQTYPLYPSVQHLLLSNGLSKDDANKIPASGPAGRLLKGDVLAYLGKIEKNYPDQQAKRMDKLAHLDLSNIQLAAPSKKPEAKPVEAEKPAPIPDTEIALPISLSAVLETQKRVYETLGINVPLSTLIARASELANENLPLSKNRKPTADELFNSVLGLNNVSSKTSRGHYVPQITGLLPTAPVSTSQRAAKKADIFDILAGKPSGPKKAPKTFAAQSALAAQNVFSVSAPKGDEKRAQEYLERMKQVLEAEPGRLVL